MISEKTQIQQETTNLLNFESKAGWDNHDASKSETDEEDDETDGY
jgi:hypothetical protein